MPEENVIFLWHFLNTSALLSVSLKRNPLSKKEQKTSNPIIFLEKSIDVDSEEKQELKGFNPKYHNFVDYIIKITHEIWEEKGVGVIYDTYAEDIVLHVAACAWFLLKEKIMKIGNKDFIYMKIAKVNKFRKHNSIGSCQY